MKYNYSKYSDNLGDQSPKPPGIYRFYPTTQGAILSFLHLLFEYCLRGGPHSSGITGKGGWLNMTFWIGKKCRGRLSHPLRGWADTVLGSLPSVALSPVSRSYNSVSF